MKDDREVVVSEEHAMLLFSLYRAELIQQGRSAARELAEENGVVYAQLVWDRLVEWGVLSDRDERSARWMGALFKEHEEGQPVWAHVGYTKVGHNGRNVHSSPRSVWALAHEAVEEPFPEILDCAASDIESMLFRASIVNSYNYPEVLLLLKWVRQRAQALHVARLMRKELDQKRKELP